MSAASIAEQRAWKRRGIAMHRVMARIREALGPFAPKEGLLFDPSKGFSTLEVTAEQTIRKVRNAGFFEQLYSELPPSLRRKFLLLDRDDVAPTTKEYRLLERRILGYARRKLKRELTARINTLPNINSMPLPRGRNGGRLRLLDSDERRRIRARVKELMQTGSNGKPMSKRHACATTADERNISERHVWRIVLGH